MNRTLRILFLSLAVVVSPSHGGAQIINTIAGNGTLGSAGDGGPATAANLYGPQAVQIHNGIVYTSENGRIRAVNTAGVINTVAGNGVFGHSGDGGAATSANIGMAGTVIFDDTGNMYFDEPNGAVRKVIARVSYRPLQGQV